MPEQEAKNQHDEHLTDVQMLDSLIEQAYKKLNDEIGKDPKLGDFLKMIETRHKLAPQRSAQNEFWKMIDRIREENAAKDQSAPTAPATSAKPNKPRTSSKGGK